MKKALLLAASLAIFIAFIWFSGPLEMLKAIATFNPLFVPLVLGCAVANYFFRFLRWELLLKQARVGLERRTSLLMFLAGFLMTVSPAKVGEVIKSYYLKRVGVKYRKSLPIVISERVYDLIGIVLLMFLSSVLFASSPVMLSLLLLVALAAAVLFSDRLIGVMLRLSGKRGSALVSISKGVKGMFARKLLLSCTMLSLAGWFMECAGLYLVVTGFGVGASLIRETFVYSTATVAGVVSMLPGGVGVTEGSLSALLADLAGISLPLASSISVVIRLFTIWFAVLLGYVANVLLVRSLKKP
jgi:uncharacterized protein (TIRG00374 family)